MGQPSLTRDRAAFAERLRVQLASRYRGVAIGVDAGRFALHVTAPGIDTTLPLTPLHNACARDAAAAPALIARYVASVERQMTPRTGTELSPARLLWCVRSRAYLEGMSRAGDLLSEDVAADLVAFVAEELPGAIMRGVAREEWAAAEMRDDAVRAAAADNTAARFARLVDRIRGVDRIPADGWRMAGDPLFQSSVVAAPTVLGALVARAGGDVLLGAPDRGVVLAIPAAQPQADRFARRVLREWREAMNPCSHQVVVTDGSNLRAAPQRVPRGSAAVMPWLDS